MINLDLTLLENYAKLLSRLYSTALQPFYESSVLSNVPIITQDRIKERIRVHKIQLVDYDTVKQRHMLWHTLTSAQYLPLFPCKRILPIMCTYWNSIKYVGDYITQMLWLRKFHPPRLSPQVCATMKLTYYLPQYQIHRLYQLISQQDISHIYSPKQYRKIVRKTTTLFDSMKDTQTTIGSMIAENE